MFLVKSAGKKIALEVLPVRGERGEYLLLCWLCLTHCDAYSISSGDLRNFTKLSDRWLVLTKRCTCILFPFTKHWWQANTISTILWIRNEHRAVKWHQGLFWGRQMDHLPLLLFPAGHWSLMVLAPLSKHVAAKYPSRWTATVKKINNGNVMFTKTKTKTNKLENRVYWLLCSSNSVEKQKGRKTKKCEATNAV